MRSEKLKWGRVDGGFDLICLNPDQLNMKAVKKLLPKIEIIYDDFKKPFNKDASKLLKEWIKDPSQPLQVKAYCLLSNWFLTEDPAASISIRAGLTLLLWRKLFCAVPERRLTYAEKDYKIIKKEFDLWWPKQQKCQKIC